MSNHIHEEQTARKCRELRVEYLENDIKEIVATIQRDPEAMEWEQTRTTLEENLNEIYKLVGLDKTIGVMYRSDLYTLAFHNWLVSLWICHFTNELLGTQIKTKDAHCYVDRYV